MDFEKYRNQLPYPRKEDFSTIFYYKGGKVVHQQKPGEAIELSEDAKRGALREVVTDEAAYRAAQAAYHAETSRLTEQFYADVKEDLGIKNNPKADKLMQKAWGLGHSAGFAEVYNYASDLVDLIED